MLIGFFFYLRGAGLRVSLTEWLALTRALVLGHGRASLSVFYHLARSLLVKRESDYDLYDRCFASYFEGIDGTLELSDELLSWLQDPKLLRELSDEERALLKSMDLETLREELEQRLREQKERHDGGSHWVGTGGTSPFGHGGYHPTGVRIGGPGGARSAVQVAENRRFKNLRNDVVLDTRQMGVALRRLRRLAKDGGPEELDLEGTIDKTAREGGEIDLVFSRPKKNRIKLLLLVDVGGSMDPHAELCERLFAAAHAQSHFAKFQAYYFHNCPYEKLYTDIFLGKGAKTDDVLKHVDGTWAILFVGDAWMSPYELTHADGAISYWEQNRVTGLERLRRFRQRSERIAWLNPEPRRIWHAPSIQIIRELFPMYELTVDGLTEAVDLLRGARRPGG